MPWLYGNTLAGLRNCNVWYSVTYILTKCRLLVGSLHLRLQFSKLSCRFCKTMFPLFIKINLGETLEFLGDLQSKVNVAILERPQHSHYFLLWTISPDRRNDKKGEYDLQHFYFSADKAKKVFLFKFFTSSNMFQQTSIFCWDLATIKYTECAHIIGGSRGRIGRTCAPHE